MCECVEWCCVVFGVWCLVFGVWCVRVCLPQNRQKVNQGLSLRDRVGDLRGVLPSLEDLEGLGAPRPPAMPWTEPWEGPAFPFAERRRASGFPWEAFETTLLTLESAESLRPLLWARASRLAAIWPGLSLRRGTTWVVPFLYSATAWGCFPGSSTASAVNADSYFVVSPSSRPLSDSAVLCREEEREGE